MSDDILERRARETERILALYEREAHKYDREMRVFEKLLFGGGREWICSQAEGEVLEIAVGTGRNLPFYGEGVPLTGVELSPAMLEIARGRARDLGRDADLRVGDAHARLSRRTVRQRGVHAVALHNSRSSRCGGRGGLDFATQPNAL